MDSEEDFYGLFVLLLGAYYTYMAAAAAFMLLHTPVGRLSQGGDYGIYVCLAIGEDESAPDRRSLPDTWELVARTDALFELVPQWPDSKFERFFKMTRVTFETVVEELLKDDQVQRRWCLGAHGKRRGRRPRFCLRRVLMATLLRLTSGLNEEQVGDFFGMSGWSVHQGVHLLVGALKRLQHTWIKWPNAGRKCVIKCGFQCIAGLRNCIGAVDGVHVPVTMSMWQADGTNLEPDYVDRKGNHTILMQGIVDHQRRFTNISVGWPGNNNDARVFRVCSVSKQSRQLFEPGEYLVGDSAYPCKAYCIPPYSRRSRLAPYKKTFNHFHSQTRVTVEHSFGLLKGRFKILKNLNVNLDNSTKFITACVVLHNITVDARDTYSPKVMPAHVPLPNRSARYYSDVRGKRHRDRIADMVTSESQDTQCP